MAEDLDDGGVEVSQRLVEAQAAPWAFGSAVSLRVVTNRWAAVTRVVWWCQPCQVRPSKWAGRVAGRTRTAVNRLLIRPPGFAGPVLVPWRQVISVNASRAPARSLTEAGACRYRMVRGRRTRAIRNPARERPTRVSAIRVRRLRTASRRSTGLASPFAEQIHSARYPASSSVSSGPRSLDWSQTAPSTWSMAMRPAGAAFEGHGSPW